MSVSPPPDAGDGADPNLFFEAENDPDCIRFLLASDNHIGHMEKDPVRGPDAINTFKEILDIAVKNEVDFILLGGDLFHDNKPSRLTLHQTIALLREYTMGDRPISVELRSDAGRGYKEGYTFPAVNYADENINVGIPVFSIHGNHDDPQGSGAAGSLSALDLLSAAGLITYFGRTDLPDDDTNAAAPADRRAAADEVDPGIRLKPILLQKGGTKLALYGLGNIRDERLNFELRANRVRLQRPAEDTEDWFNLLVLHQNRAKHNLKAAVPEGLFDDSTNLVVWGHEHECRMVPEEVTGKPYRICQPGSSVATSLSPGETVEKSVAIVMVKGQDYRVNPIKLKTVRPFIMTEIDLEAELGELNIKADDKDRITKVLRDKVNKLVAEAVRSWDAEHADENPKPERMLPLVRLRVIYTNQVVGNPVRFGQDFAGKVANPKEVLQFHKKKESRRDRSAADEANLDLNDMDIVAAERLERVQIGSLMKQFLLKQNMEILNPKEVQDATLKYAEKDNKDALTDALYTYLAHVRAGLNEVTTEEELYDKLEGIRQNNNKQNEEDEDDEEAGDGDGTVAESSAARLPAKGKAPARGIRAASDDSMLQDMDVDDDEEDAAPAQSSRKGKAKASTRSPPKKTPRAAAARSNQQDEDDEDDDVVEAQPPPTSRASALSQLGGKKAAATRTPAKKAAAAGPKKQTGMRQSQLDFGVAASSSGSRGRTAAKKAQAKISNAVHDDDEDEEEDEIENDNDNDDGQSYEPQRGKKNTAVIEIGSSDDDDGDAPTPPPKKRARPTVGRKR
ncbi:hypothetical protein A4X13_0g2931 [Tilletia indica]|uniref:Double-strand break repair protein n=1 Tax=Tilletia indica TaxID=43049 RepID=A0A177TJH7_9BASI|nr:hypothetical protein A4X13_0g2931 [Tilletia indica]